MTEPAETTPLRGFDARGIYLLVDDVVEALRALAEAQDDRYGRQALQDAADWFGGVLAPDESASASERLEEPREAIPAEVERLGDQMAGAVARVEVFPNEDGSYWYARGVDAAGSIADAGIGQISHDGVVAEAGRRWPGAPIHEIPDALADSIWAESNPAATWNGRQRPSDRRLFNR